MQLTKDIALPLDKLYHWEQEQPDQVFMKQPINGQYRELTWKETADEARRMASVLKAMDLPAGSNIALVSKNCAHWIICDLAIMMAGHVSVPIYPNVHADTIEYILGHSESKVLFAGKLDDWNSMKDGVPDGVRVISFPWYGPEGYEKWDDLTARYDPIPDNPRREADELMTIIYTSGTTGKPKGVMHTFFGLSYAITRAMDVIDAIQHEARFFSYLPLSHIAERMLAEFGGIFSGGEVHFAESLDTFQENLQYTRPTIFLAVPRIWTKFQMGILSKLPQKKLDTLLKIPLINNLIRNKIKKGLGLDKTKMFLTGAAPTPVSLMEWYEKLGILIHEVYGMTENCAYTTFNEIPKFGTAGTRMPEADVIISDIGEILVDVKCNMQGYYKEPEMTQATFQGKYLRTGDKGEFDSDGYLKITGRVKDLFKTSKAKYVAPAPIELALAKNTHIEQICVAGTGLPQPIAMVVLSEEAYAMDKKLIANSIAETLKSVNKTLDHHEVVHRAIIVKEAWTVENSMLTPTMKIKRGPVEQHYGPHFETWFGSSEVVVWE